MEKQKIKFITIPIPMDFHRKFKAIASIRGKTFKALFLELAHEYFEREENRKILVHIRG